MNECNDDGDDKREGRDFVLGKRVFALLTCLFGLGAAAGTLCKQQLMTLMAPLICARCWLALILSFSLILFLCLFAYCFRGFYLFFFFNWLGARHESGAEQRGHGRGLGL